MAVDTTQPALDGPSVVPERPALAADVELVGEARDTAFEDRQWLIQRGGRYIQVSEPVYRVAEYASGEHTLDDIAGRVTEHTEWALTSADVREILASTLIPLAVVRGAGGATPAPRPGPPSPLQVNMRVKVLGPRVIDPIASALRVLHAPVVLPPAVVAILAAHVWVYGIHGLSATLRDIAYTPGSLVAVVALYLASGVFHEFGHASALRYGGGRARSIGLGVYGIFPAYYTDTTDSYRLGRWGRVRTDLGGFYFHLLFALALVGVSVATGHDWLLLAVVLINLDVVRQLFPFVRFDGYWALTDLLGIPDILTHMRSTLSRGLSAERGLGVPALKRWAATVFAVYMLVTLPVLGLLLGLLLLRGPLLLSAVWNALLLAGAQVAQAWSAAQVPSLAVAALQWALLAIQAVALLYVLYAFLRQVLRAVWRWSRPSRRRRAAGAAFSGVALGVLASYWISSFGAAFASAPAGAQTFQVTERTHVQGSVAYPQNPPVGGPHSPIWQNCGFYTTPVANENAVHSMEHGAVWITYRPDLPQSQVAALRVIATRQPYVLVSPYPGLPAPVVASGWGSQLRLPSGDDPRLDQFVRVYRLSNRAPERGSPCSGGIGAPSG